MLDTFVSIQGKDAAEGGEDAKGKNSLGVPQAKKWVYVARTF